MKLVAETGVGTVAAGVAKANADIILISGHDGGTGASPISSIKHAGLPWELGVAETQQVLMLNNLRDRVTLRTDGGMRSGLDIVTRAILGAEEFNFGTIALIAMGCVYVRQCHLNTCPVGIATQDPKYRAKFKGKPDTSSTSSTPSPRKSAKYLARLGVRKLNDIIGRPEFLRQRHVPGHPKANTLDLGRMLHDVAKDKGADLPRIWNGAPTIGIHARPLDDKIIQRAKDAITDRIPVTLDYKVRNTNRNLGTKLTGEVALHHGDHGLPEGTITLESRRQRRPELRRIPLQRDQSESRRRGQRLRRQKHDRGTHRHPPAREARNSSPPRIRSSATPASTAPPAAACSPPAAPANVSPSATPGAPSSSKASAITAANT